MLIEFDWERKQVILRVPEEYAVNFAQFLMAALENASLNSAFEVTIKNWCRSVIAYYGIRKRSR